MPDAPFKPIPVDDAVEVLPDDPPEPKPIKAPAPQPVKPQVKPNPDLVPGASVARSRIPPDGPPVVFKPIQAQVFDLSDKEQLAKYQSVLQLMDQGNAVRALKTQLMPCPDLGTWMVLLHWREIDWTKTKAGVARLRE